MNISWQHRCIYARRLIQKGFHPIACHTKVQISQSTKGKFYRSNAKSRCTFTFSNRSLREMSLRFFIQKNFFQPFISENLLEHDNMAYQMTCNGKKITTILLINFSIVFEKVSFVAFCLSLCFHNILYFIVNHYLQYFFQDNVI